MNKWIQLAALSLVMGTVGHPVEAAPVQAPGAAGALTEFQAFKKYGYPSSLYLDGKGGKFLIYALKDGGRLMFKLMPNRLLVRADHLPLEEKPTRAVQPPSPVAPHDRYHPGVKLLARSGQKSGKK